MTGKTNFGKRTIEALTLPAEGRARYKDSEHRFLYLDVFPSGRKTFQYVRKIDGKMKFIKLGNYPEMTPTEARIKADEQSRDISRGEIPSAGRKAGKTFADIFTNYLEGHLKTEARTWPEDLRRFKVYLPPLHNMPVKHIKPEVIRDLHKKLAKERGEVSANRIIQLVRRTFNYAIEQGAYIPNPAGRLKKFKERSRERYLDEIEIKRFFTALDTLNLNQRDFFKVALFTGARRANIQAMKWEDIDLERKIWTISAEEFKTGEPKEVILSDIAIEILAQRLEKTESEYVFPSYGKNGHIIEIKGIWKILLEKAGIKDFHFHDLRRTFGSYQAKEGASLPIIGKSLGHTSTEATQIYARLNNEPVRESVEAATRAILKAANGGENEKV